jgi:potassium-transporting ATPase potassium-binding subunit
LQRVFSRAPTALDPIMAPLERVVYRWTRVDLHAEMTAVEYSVSFVLFGLAGTLVLYGILRLQRFLPWFFAEFHTTPLSPDLSFNVRSAS